LLERRLPLYKVSLNCETLIFLKRLSIKLTLCF
jgi:hypothetical protein